jgi:DnaJ-class molecular chaperone
MTVHIVPCPACNGEGGHSWPVDINRFNGDVIEQTSICRVCDGTGEIEEEVEGIADPDELDEACPPQGEPA